VVGIDGLSGAGKSTFAGPLAAALDAPCLHMDELVPGWGGLAESIDRLVGGVLEPLDRGEPAGWRRYDWAGDRPGEWVDLPDCTTLVVEGCCVGLEAPARHLSFLVWIDAPEAERVERLHRRADRDAYEPYYAQWLAQELSLREGTHVAERADLVVDNSDAATTARRAAAGPPERPSEGFVSAASRWGGPGRGEPADPLGDPTWDTGQRRDDAGLPRRGAGE
jgi:hypothetical protein